MRHLTNDEVLQLIEEKKGFVILESHRVSKHVFEALASMLGEDKTTNFTVRKNEILFKNGSLLFVIPGPAPEMTDRLRGRKFDYCIVNEEATRQMLLTPFVERIFIDDMIFRFIEGDERETS